jgi:hypothetical protein
MAVRRILTLVVLGCAVGLLVAVQWAYFQRGLIPGDAIVYLAAGERLNAGHQLYSLTAGDRPLEIKPPLWTVPLLSPPPIAVVFRPLAVLPPDSGAYVWWAMQLLALTASIVMLARRKPLATAAALVVLVIPTVYEAGVGNLNSFLLLGLILSWRWAMDGHEERSGVIAGVLTAFKLTPAAMVWWLLVIGRRRAVIAAIVAAFATLAVSLLGAGLGSHIDYLRILGDRGAVGNSPLSLGGMATYIGIDATIADRLPTIAIGIGLLAVFLLRRHPALAYAATVLTMIYGSPAVSINWYVLMYALLAPLAWPAVGQQRSAEANGQPAQESGLGAASATG